MDRIDVCICTFRRPSVAATIATVAAQDVRATIDLRIVVADNEEQPAAREVVEAAGRRFGIAVRYVHAPARNISIARNACLAAATADWIAFIDDDEEAAPDWLRRLIAGHEGIDIAFGVSEAIVARPGAPAWIATGAFHSNRQSGNDAAHNGYTCNVLMRRAFVEAAALRFLPALGTTGGEDTLFFDDARRAGARFAYRPDAIVREEIPDGRATLGWLLRRRFRSGQTHHFLMRRNRAGGALLVPAAAAKAVAMGALAAANLFRPARAADYALRGALHVGVVAAALGSATYQEYS